MQIKHCCEQLTNNGEKVTAPKINSYMELNMSTHTTQQILKSCVYKYKSARPTIVLTKRHKLERVRICTQWLRDRIDFNRVVFSDQKRFSLDGPDN